MGDEMTVTTRTFIVKEGMTPEDVIKSPNATAQQKKMAYVFDSDGVAGYSQREADVFNATTISDHGKQGVSLWTQYADGTKKGTLVKGDLKAFKYAPEGDIKPKSHVAFESGKPAAKKVEKKPSYVKRGTLSVPANYTNSFIGEDGIKADTISRYKSNNSPAIIVYREKKNVLRKEDFDEKGKLEGYTEFGEKNKDGWYEFEEYDASGKHLATGVLEGEHQRRIYYKNVKPGELEELVENTKTGNTVYYSYSANKYGSSSQHYFRPDGTDEKDVYHTFRVDKVGDREYVRSGNRIVEYDRQGNNIVKETRSGDDNYEYKDGKTAVIRYSGGKKSQVDVLDDKDMLKYTIYPKYNKDGLLIKNDTVWNQK